jgi:NTE family protein
VLGGGGPVGRGWQAGLLTGLTRGGVDLSAADLIVGTSAGAILGALLTTHADLTPDLDQAPRMGRLVPGFAPSREASVRAEFGRAALAADTVSETEALSRAMFAQLTARDWPRTFAATVVNARTGEFRVLRASDGMPLGSAVAASAALPGVSPPITLGGERYVDGGVRSLLNADVAAGHDVVLVISCFPIAAADEADIAAQRSTGARVLEVTPDDRLQGANMLDPGLVPRAYEVGVSQAQAEAGRLVGEW